jgi:hypothetical protein
VGSGNIAEITVHPPDTTPGGDTDWFIAVYNDSCADYYVRVVVTRAASDAGAPILPDAGASDAASEGGLADASD